MVRNVNKEDLDTLSKLLGKTFKEEEVDFELSMLDEVDSGIFSVFLVGKNRVPYEIGAVDEDDFVYNEVLGVYTQDEEDESLTHTFYETMAATRKMVFFWKPWTEEDAKILLPTFTEDIHNNLKYLSCIAFPKITKYKKNEKRIKSWIMRGFTIWGRI